MLRIVSKPRLRWFGVRAGLKPASDGSESRRVVRASCVVEATSTTTSTDRQSGIVGRSADEVAVRNKQAYEGKKSGNERGSQILSYKGV